MSPLLKLAMRAARQCLTTPPFCELHDPPPISLVKRIAPLSEGDSNSAGNIVGKQSAEEFLGCAMYAVLLELGYTDEDAAHWLAQESVA